MDIDSSKNILTNQVIELQEESECLKDKTVEELKRGELEKAHKNFEKLMRIEKERYAHTKVLNWLREK